jgi:hypothetical protein
MVEVKYHKNVLLFFDELTDILIEKGYFSSYDYSAKYIEDLVDYVRTNIALRQHKKTPDHFSKYGDDLYYISYRRNQKTTWFIMFQKSGNRFFVRHIINNHVSEYQYFNI